MRASAAGNCSTTTTWIIAAVAAVAQVGELFGFTHAHGSRNKGRLENGKGRRCPAKKKKLEIFRWCLQGNENIARQTEEEKTHHLPYEEYVMHEKGRGS